MPVDPKSLINKVHLSPEEYFRERVAHWVDIMGASPRSATVWANWDLMKKYPGVHVADLWPLVNGIKMEKSEKKKNGSSNTSSLFPK